MRIPPLAFIMGIFAMSIFIFPQKTNALFELPNFDKILQPTLEILDQQAQVCQPNSRTVCQCDNRFWGYAVCNAQGTEYNYCENDCRYRSQAEAQASLAPRRICSAGQRVFVQCDNSFWGSEVCNAQGTDWNIDQNCQYRTQAEAQANLSHAGQICKANSSRVCKCGNQKWGYQTCNAQSTLYGKCNNACNYSFPSQVPLPKTPTLDPNTIKALINLVGQQGNVCTPNTKRACTCDNRLPGQQICKANGSVWGTCGSCGLVGIPAAIEPPVVTPPPPPPALPIIDSAALNRVLNPIQPNLDPTILKGIFGVFGTPAPTPAPAEPEEGQEAPELNQETIDVILKAFNARPDKDSLNRLLDAQAGQEGEGAPEEEAEGEAVVVLSLNNEQLMAQVIQDLLAQLGQQGARGQAGAGVEADASGDVMIAGVIEDLLAAFGQQQINHAAVGAGAQGGANVVPPVEHVDVNRVEQLADAYARAATSPNAEEDIKNTATQLQKLTHILRAQQEQAKENQSVLPSSTRGYTILLIGSIVLLLAIIAGFVAWVMRA